MVIYKDNNTFGITILDLDTTCIANVDCDTTTNPNSACTGTLGFKTCTCKSGYNKQGTACKASK
ncbi:hypothetical protein DPMN_099309 [Dreissena polymorpha]|uniref:EGF-like domain-containing protein n=1 Tax=Dreissena polymorpha TaxID=45954 RepID=A0A9D4LEP4_DREPO|nr:hypothetical protein DPMN_099309 [Dreissena polymorpha]